MHRLMPSEAAEAVHVDDAFWVDDVGDQYVRAAMIASVDGAAQLQGRAGGLSGPADVALLAALRGQSDVILAGAGTVRAERYGGEIPSPERLAWRQSRGLSSAPPMAVVTASGRLDPSGPFFTSTVARPLVLTSSRMPAEQRHRLAEVSDLIICGDDRVDLGVALDALAERGLRRVHCEGGPHLLAQLVACHRLDELSLTVSPLIVSTPALRIVEAEPGSSGLQLELTEVFAEDSFLFLRYQQRRRQP